jgi:hypothetical protein
VNSSVSCLQVWFARFGSVVSCRTVFSLLLGSSTSYRQASNILQCFITEWGGYKGLWWIRIQVRVKHGFRGWETTVAWSWIHNWSRSYDLRMISWSLNYFPQYFEFAVLRLKAKCVCKSYFLLSEDIIACYHMQPCPSCLHQFLASLSPPEFHRFRFRCFHVTSGKNYFLSLFCFHLFCIMPRSL